MAVFANIRYFLYNGGGDFQTPQIKSLNSIGRIFHQLYWLKTVDNDLPITDTCPGFGSVASMLPCQFASWAGRRLHVREFYYVFVMEVMGRHRLDAGQQGWRPSSRGRATSFCFRKSRSIKKVS